MNSEKGFPKLTEEQMERRLRHPEGQVRTVLDTDAFNEVDDQFALAYALLSPEKLSVEAVTAAPFFNWNSTSPGEGMEKSYQEIKNIYELMELKSPPPVFRGSDRYLEAPGVPVESEAADEIIRLAKKDPKSPLYVVAIGAITNVASAIAKDPSIIENIVVVWLGPNAFWYPHHEIFNVSQDYYASSLIYESGVPLVILPCHDVASHLHTNVYEIDAVLRGKNRIGTYFSDMIRGRFTRFGKDTPGWSKVLWDVSCIAWLLNEEWVPSEIRPCPVLREDFTYAWLPDGHQYKEAYFADRSEIFMDMFRKLTNHKNW